MDPTTKRTVWIVAIAILLVALVAHHNITTQEIILICVVIPSIIVHEISHGVVANWFGDDTAKRAGRLTLNPVPHIDPLGTIIVPVLLSFTSFGVIGWAKPVPVNPGRLRSPRNQGVLVSLAGPATNAVLAATLGLVFVSVIRDHLPLAAVTTSQWSVAAQVVFLGSWVNVALCAFNMIPIPPLDGSVLLERLLPARWWPTYLRYRRYTMPALIGLVLLNFFLVQNGRTGPLTWLFNELFTWWSGVLGIHFV